MAFGQLSVCRIPQSGNLRAAHKILAQLSKGAKPSADTLTKLIAAEFEELSA